MNRSVLSTLAALWVPLAGASEGVGQVMAATPKCALINAPTSFALITGNLDIKQGDLVVGDFGFHSYGTLKSSEGAPVGVNVFVEETALTVEGLEIARQRIKRTC